jgi:hypothetical protein
MHIREVGSFGLLPTVAIPANAVEGSINPGTGLRVRSAVTGCAPSGGTGFVAALAGELLVRDSGEPLEAEVPFVVPCLHSLGRSMEAGKVVFPPGEGVRPDRDNSFQLGASEGSSRLLGDLLRSV